MNHQHHHLPPVSKAWKFRLRLATLICFLTLGLGIAAIERWRQDSFDHVWGRIHEPLTSFLTPISERTNRIFMVISKVDRLLKVEELNKGLLRDYSKLNIENQRLSEELGRLNRLAGLGRWSGPSDLTFLSADVVGLITSGQSAALLINRGREDGVRPRDPVVALSGLVGIVQSVSRNTARVQAITDSVSAIGVMDRTSRARGILFGRGRNEKIEFMPENEVQPINIGGVLITSGFENSVYPKGVIVGTITECARNTYGMPYGVVKPAVSFESLEEVLLVIPRGRLAGKEDQPTSLTMGSRRIFMPGGSPLTTDYADVPTSASWTVYTDTTTTPTVQSLPDPDEDDGSSPTSATLADGQARRAVLPGAAPPAGDARTTTSDQTADGWEVMTTPTPTPAPPPRPTPRSRRSGDDTAPEDLSR